VDDKRGEGSPTKKPPTVEALNVAPTLDRVTKAISLIRANGAYWGELHKRHISVIGYYTLTATIIMGVNLLLKENVRSVGGWIPFCLAAAVITAIASWLVNRQQSEDAMTHRNRCFDLLARYEAFSRDLETKQWTERKFQILNKKLTQADGESGLYRMKAPRIRSDQWLMALLGLIVLTYIVTQGVVIYSSYASSGHSAESISK
jgi:hypothetical protein